MKVHTIALRIALIAVTISVSACASNPAAREWKQYTVNISGKVVSLSAPEGDFPVKYRASTDLSENKKDSLVLFESAWILSGGVADSGALDVKLILRKLPSREPNVVFLDAVRGETLREVGAHFPNAEVTNVSTRSLGGREWVCFTVLPIRSYDCVLEIDSLHYLVWRAGRINNGATGENPARKELTNRIEQSIHVAF